MTLEATTLCNEFSRRWASNLSSEDNEAFSGPGAWLMLAALLSGANGEAREELEKILGVTKSVAHLGVASLLEQFARNDSITMAGGLWFNPKINIHNAYTHRLHPFHIQPFPEDRSELDHWVRSHTSGRIEGFAKRPAQFRETPDPIAHSETMILVASVLSARADWKQPFIDVPGHWGPRDEPCNWLSRGDQDLEAAALISTQGTTVSRVICETLGGFDVHLLGGGERDKPATVLGAGYGALAGRAKTVSAARLQEGDSGGCLSVRYAARQDNENRLRVSLPAFEISTSHDLTAKPELFGIASALDPCQGHFPEISDTPLYIGRAEQSVATGFQADGFYADALTEVEMRFTGLPSQSLVVDVSFDRPFGFLVVERASGLAVFSGWVARTEAMWGNSPHQ